MMVMSSFARNFLLRIFVKGWFRIIENFQGLIRKLVNSLIRKLQKAIISTNLSYSLS